MIQHSTEIVWRLYLASPPDRVFAFLSTDEGRSSFWAESTVQSGSELIFHFPNGESMKSRILDVTAVSRLTLTYFNGSIVRFDLFDAGPGTELVLTESGVAPVDEEQNRAGWVSILLNLKASADHGIDLRNHDPRRTWSDGYVDN